MKPLLRIAWPLIALFLFFLLLTKFFLAGWLSGPVSIAVPVAGVVICLYLLFLLEGTQVVGIKIKDLDSDAVERFLQESSGAPRERVMEVHRIFANNFDGFVTGRQVFVIMTVVTMAYLIKQLDVPNPISPAFLESRQLDPDGATAAFAITMSTILGWKPLGLFEIFPWAISTLVPAWISQLLPQFFADKGAMNFIGTPLSLPVLKMAMFLDNIQLGQPAKVLLRLFGKSASDPAEQIPIGKSAFYDTSINFYGRAKKIHQISIGIGETSLIQERIVFVFKRGITEHLDHIIRLKSPIVGELRGRAEMPNNVHMELASSHSRVGDDYVYAVRLEFNQPLPLNNSSEDEVELVLAYETATYTDAVRQEQTIRYATQLPTKLAVVRISAESHLLRLPKVSVREAQDFYAAAPNVAANEHWSISTPDAKQNHSTIVLDHPTVGTIYEVRFSLMEKAIEPRFDAVDTLTESLGAVT